ncbi:DNA-formamidopyrimidine glycosylase [Anaerobacillus alkalilacustris]|uniref:Formamidopyrimidine-DNA glycosylase n=1 Tax=Anaerobacillus alkalilacustris TaxID=393763 RepID=A0A1S2LL23_9BACI|nr:DNA-formamidopyrimidine glycosylase [Anaerobacillus alkalilacustris]OIJ12387.1 DNA-formamidopyrimidine glycosylase [Anaerobacillus alkalilacustris]
MPELPEVETVKRTLQKLVIGKTIKDITVHWGKIIKRPDDVAQFRHLLIGQTIINVERRAKFLKLIFNDYVVVSHLRMEGRYGLYKVGEPITKHTHVIFSFTDGTELRYQDVRKFGTMHLFIKGEEECQLPLVQLGIEPFDNLFTPKKLKELFEGTNRKVKVTLLDQTKLVGLGNIYVDEALFRSGIYPERIGKELTQKELKKLYQEIKATLQEAINMGGSSVKSYVNGQGEMGMFQQTLFVYGRKGEPCKRCGTEIEKTVVGGRGTHFCPKCQKK